MTIADAFAFRAPLGPHRHQPLGLIALDHADYLGRVASGELAEGRPGTPFHTAATLIVDRIVRSMEDAVLRGETLDSVEYGRSVLKLTERNRDVLSRAHAVESRKGTSRKSSAEARGPAGLFDQGDEAREAS